VSDIATASSEQASGVEEVNKALTQMDEVTQQNSALVEEATATAKTLDEQARAMSERVSFFQLEDDAQSHAPSQKSASVAPARAAMPAQRSQAPRPRAVANGAMR